jgi:hypothetical protein
MKRKHYPCLSRGGCSLCRRDFDVETNHNDMLVYIAWSDGEYLYCSQLCATIGVREIGGVNQ